MAKKYLGKNRSEQREWLLNEWLRFGPPVCFLQGFAGTGKSDLVTEIRGIARREKGWNYAVLYEIADRPVNVQESLMELSGSLTHEGLPQMEEYLFRKREPNNDKDPLNLAHAVELALRNPVLIIIDESQRLLGDDDQRPTNEMLGIFAHLRNNRDLPGRLLLVSDRVIDTGPRWAEWIPKRILTKLDQPEAVELLQLHLKELNIADAIPKDRKVDELVEALDCNPRAIEALAAALTFESLDDIIGSKPGLWDTTDRKVSRGFIEALERHLFERIQSHMDPGLLKKLRILSVHRRGFKKKAIQLVCDKAESEVEVTRSLVSRFLLGHRSGIYAISPMVRVVSLSAVKRDTKEHKQAHGLAARYNGRHFLAKDMGSNVMALSESFAELRYHLVQAEQADELTQLAERFTDYLKIQIKSESPVPQEPGELNERIAVLKILLEKEGAKGLEYHLARCLQKRASGDDFEHALCHAERATGRHAPFTAWELYARLTDQVKGGADATTVVRNAIKVIPPEANLFALYQYGGQILERDGKPDEAVTLLSAGIKVVPASANLFALYQSCAEILERDGKPGEAVTLLTEGISQIEAKYSVSALYRAAGRILVQNGRAAEAVALLEKGIAKVPLEYNVFWLYEGLALTYENIGDIESAKVWLTKGGEQLTAKHGLPSLCWTAANILLKANDPAEGLRWAQRGTKVEPKNQYLIAAAEKCRKAIHDQQSAMGQIDAYVSYAWGEDTSAAGKEREEIVDRLCDGARKNGYVVGRDKERLRGGASIDRFAKEIADASRIIAVISAKSLRSDYCMVRELFRAFQQCNYERASFQKKVIALVLNDAKPLLKDEAAFISLTEEWQVKHDRLKQSLLKVDAERKNLDTWRFIQLMEEMVGRLPEMLSAIADIVMERGFEAIVANEFKEVMELLSQNKHK